VKPGFNLWAVLGKRITRNYKVVVTRHEMMGGRVEQVPERAPARLVTSREVKTEVELARYGNDVVIDTSRHLVPNARVPPNNLFAVI
jgi:hypothetical protein